MLKEKELGSKLGIVSGTYPGMTLIAVAPFAVGYPTKQITVERSPGSSRYSIQAKGSSGC
jgi:hypothetical protein